jgi:hypothetical protein
MGEPRHNGGGLSGSSSTSRRFALSETRKLGLQRLAALLVLLAVSGACAYEAGLPFMREAADAVASHLVALLLGVLGIATALLIWDKARIERRTAGLQLEKSQIELEKSRNDLEKSRNELEAARLAVMETNGPSLRSVDDGPG